MTENVTNEGTAASVRASNLPVVVQGWLNDIDRALRDVFASESEEDEAFDSATYGLDALRAYLEKEATDG